MVQLLATTTDGLDEVAVSQNAGLQIEVLALAMLSSAVGKIHGKLDEGIRIRDYGH